MTIFYCRCHQTFGARADGVQVPQRGGLQRLEEYDNFSLSVRIRKEKYDLTGAAQALIRLQDTYELNMTELARGNLWGRQTHAGTYLH